MVNIESLFKIEYGRNQAFYSNGINQAYDHGHFWVIGENRVCANEGVIRHFIQMA